jgi:hypothetical protein
MGAHVIWLGPVSREQRAGATIQGAEEHFVSCTGDGSGGTKRCRALAEALGDNDGRHLPGLLRQLGIPEGEELYLGAFSAGGSAVKVLLAHPDDRAAIRAVMLADATYELRGSDGKPAPSPSLVAYAQEALADGSRMLVATASAAPNNRLGVAEPSGAQTLERIAADIEERVGARFDQASYIEGIYELHPARVWSRGSVILADFGAEYGHPEHATALAPFLWPRVLQPWLDRRKSTPDAQAGAVGAAADDGGSSALGAVLAIGAAAVLVAGVGSVLLRPARDDERTRRLAAGRRPGAWR